MAHISNGNTLEVDLIEFMKQGPVSLLPIAAEAALLGNSIQNYSGLDCERLRCARLSREEVSILIEHQRLLEEMKKSLNSVAAVTQRQFEKIEEASTG